MLEAAEEVLCKKTVSRFVLDGMIGRYLYNGSLTLFSPSSEIIRDVVAQKTSMSPQKAPSMTKEPSKPLQATPSFTPPIQIAPETKGEEQLSKTLVIEPESQPVIPPIKLEGSLPAITNEAEPLVLPTEQQKDQKGEEELDPSTVEPDDVNFKDETKEEDATLGDDLPEDTNAEDSAAEDTS